jgi:hypothetical protein
MSDETFKEKQQRLRETLPRISHDLVKYRLQQSERYYRARDQSVNIAVEISSFGANDQTQDVWSIQEFSDTGLLMQTTADGFAERDSVEYGATHWLEFCNTYVFKKSSEDPGVRGDVKRMKIIIAWA